MKYDGYVYIWYDTMAKFFYVGGHKGKVEDSYVCSNKPMLRAYKLRPDTFKFRVLEYIVGTTFDLREAEQKWLNMIKDSELMLSENVKNKKCRYYNVKKNSVGGNGSANKGQTRNVWNKGYTKEEGYLRQQGLYCFVPLDKPKSKLIKPKHVPKKLANAKKEKAIKKAIKVIKEGKFYKVNFFICEKCKSAFYSRTKKSLRFCSKKCSCSYAAKMCDTAMNGKKSASKQSDTVFGRRKYVKPDGSWIWIKRIDAAPEGTASVSRLSI